MRLRDSFTYKNDTGSGSSVSVRTACARRALVAIAGLIFTSVIGCGGGGGGSSSGSGLVTVQGTVLSASNYVPPSSPASISIGGARLTTNADGTFSVSVSAHTTTATISATGEVSRTITFALKASQINNLGNIFLADTGSDYSASANGVVVTTVNGATKPVPGATISLGNITGVSAADGTFTLTGLPVGLGSVNGLYGSVTATGYSIKLITADTLQFALVSGANNIGNLLIGKPSGNTPPPPYTVSGVIDVVGAPVAGVTVAIAPQGSVAYVAQTTTDSLGNYYLWVAPGAYTVTAQDASGTVQSVNVTVSSLTTPVTANSLNLSP